MSVIAGWSGGHLPGIQVLRAMVSACALPAIASPPEELVDGDFAAAASAPASSGAVHRTARSEDGMLMAIFGGYLYAEDPAARQAPARQCLELYRRFGTAFPLHLNGSFAAAVWDKSSRRLHLATDRLASRSLYYCRERCLVFATEIKGLLEFPAMSRVPSPERVQEFLAAAAVPGLNTYYAHIVQVPEASVLTWDGRQISISRYWAPRFVWNAQQLPLEHHAQKIAGALRNSVRRICSGHDRVGLMLSGGLDSRAIACAAEVPLTCMTMHTSRGMESELASAVARRLGHQHHFLELDPSYPLSLLGPGSLMADGMNAFHHAQPWLTAPLAHQQGLSLLLNGWALDLLFSGGMLPNANASGIRRALPPALASPAIDPVSYLAESFYRTASDRVLGSLMRGRQYRDVRQSTTDTLSRVLAERRDFALCSHDLVALAVLCNVAREESALNVRAAGRITAEGIPTFDNECLETFLALPPQYRFNYRAYGRALELLNPAVARIPRSGTGLPITRGRRDEVLQYYRVGLEFRAVAGFRKLFPNSRVLDRSCWPSIPQAMRTQPAWHQCLRRYLAESYLVDTGIVEADALRDLVEDQIAGRGSAHLLIGTWLTLEEWFRRYQ